MTFFFSNFNRSIQAGKIFQMTFQINITTIITIIFKCNTFSWINALIFLLNHGGSLSSHTTNLCGIKLLRIVRIVLLKMFTFSLMLVFKKALPIEFINYSPNEFRISIFIVPNLLHIRWRVYSFYIKFCKNYLMMTI